MANEETEAGERNLLRAQENLAGSELEVSLRHPPANTCPNYNTAWAQLAPQYALMGMGVLFLGEARQRQWVAKAQGNQQRPGLGVQLTKATAHSLLPGPGQTLLGMALSAPLVHSILFSATDLPFSSGGLS